MAAAGDWLNGTESSAKKSHGHSCPQSDQNRYSTTILPRRKFRDFEIVAFSINCTVCSSVLLLVKNQLEKLEAARSAYLWLPYWALLGLTGRYLALLSLTRPYSALLGLTGPYWALLGLTWPYLALLGLNRPYWALLGLTGPYFALLGLT